MNDLWIAGLCSFDYFGLEGTLTHQLSNSDRKSLASFTLDNGRFDTLVGSGIDPYQIQERYYSLNKVIQR